MSFSVCKLAETRRNRERKRNNPAGLICLIFIICTFFYNEPATAAVNCTTDYGTDSSIDSSPYKNKTVFYLNTGCTFDYNCNHLDVGSNAYGNHPASNGSDTTCSSNFDKPDWCRICANCDSSPVANRCGTNGDYHAERVACSGSSQYDVIRNSTRQCKDMPFGPLVQKQSTTVNLHTADQVDNPKMVTWSYNNITFTFSTAFLNQGAVCTFNKPSPTFSSSTGSTCQNLYEYSVPNDPEGTNYNLTASDVNWSALHCTAGSVVWKAEGVTAGDAAHGFYVLFKEIAGDCTSNPQKAPNPKIKCTGCQTGWKLTTSNCGHDLCSCDTSKNFVGGYVSGKCLCKKGYRYDSSQDKCVDTDADSRNFVSPNNDGTYYCKPGYKVSLYTSPGSATDYQYYYCEPCKTDENFVPGGPDGCQCDTGYTMVDYEPDPENASCVINTGAVFVDSTGWFTIPGPGDCRTDWWQE